MIDLDAVRRLFSDDPRSVLDAKELPAYKRTQPRANERIIDCFDVPRLINDLVKDFEGEREGAVKLREEVVELRGALAELRRVSKDFLDASSEASKPINDPQQLQVLMLRWQNAGHELRRLTTSRLITARN